MLYDTPNSLTDRLQNCKEEADRSSGEISLKGNLKNLRVEIKGNNLNVNGSLTKYFKGNNLHNPRFVIRNLQKLANRKIENVAKDL